MYLKWQLLIVGFLLSFQLLGQASLEGTVKGKNQANLENVAVVLLPGNQGTVTDKNGFFQFNDLSAGDYVLQFSLLGYSQREQKVTVSEAGSVLETIQMEANPFVMDEVLVNAIRAGEKTPMTYTNLNKMQLEEQNLGQDVPFLLRWTPSAIVTSDAGAGIGYTGIRIRGSDPTRINVTINGIPLNDAESQGVFWVNMPDFVSSTDNIQVQRGVGTSSNGAGAFGATINMNTAKVNQDASASINTSVGSFNTFRRNVQFGTGLINDRFVIDGRLSKITSDGYIDRASSDLSSYFVSAAYVGDRTTLRFNTFAGHEITYQAWNGVPADMVDDRETRTFNSAGLEKPGEPHNNEVDDYTQRHYQLHFNQQLSARTNANIALHYTQGFGFFEQYKADQDLADYGRSNPDFPDAQPDLIRRRWLDNDFYGLVYSLNTSKNKVDFTIGGGYNIYEGRHFGEVIWSELAFGQDPSEPYYDNDGRKTDFNVYSKLSYAFNPKLEGYLDLQFRQVGYEFLGFDINRNNVTQTDDLSFFNPKLGLHYEISDQSSAYASFAVANREPNRNDYVESTPASRPSHEQLYDTELGYRYNGKKAAFEATAYYMYYIDQLALNGQINDVGAATRINIDESYRLGLELNGGYQISKQLDLQAGATFSSNKVIAFDEFVDTYLDDGGFEQTMVSHEDTDLAFSPNVIASFGVNWKPFAGAEWMGAHDLNVSLLNKYISRQFIDNTSDENNVIDPYTFTDLRINLSLKKVLVNEIEISLLVQNIFDALYEANAWSYRYIAGGSTFVDRGLYPQATRNFLLGVNLKF